jgi:hypothetical protein
MLRALAVCSVLLVLPRSAAAEWQFTPMIGATFFGSTNLIDHEFATDNLHRHFGGAVSLLGGGLFGVESSFVWTPGFFDDDKGEFQLVESSRSISWMGNIVLTAPRRWTEYGLRPFVSGGVGWLHTSTLEQFQVLRVNQNVIGFNVGGGAIGFFTARTGVRFDFRYHSNLNPTDEGPALVGENVRVRYLTASVGLVLRRGFR